jgi:Cu/Ag efflux protein CusF
MKRLFALILTLSLIGSVAYAHNGMEHVMGTVSAITDTSVTVTTTDGKLQTVAITPDTKYSKMDTSITLKDIKVGDHVVIHASKKNNQLTAATVKVGMDNMSGMKMDNKASPQQPK